MKSTFSEEELRLLEKLKHKYASNSTEFQNNLESLLYNKGVDYWEYIHLDALLGIQHCKTNIDDELIFVVYHQICELYFKLIQHELHLLTHNKEFLLENNWMKRIGRVVNYMDKLTHSFDIMSPGNEGEDNQFFSTEEFAKFRLSLMPASGFQTVSIRKIEMMSTSLLNLVQIENREAVDKNDIHSLYKHLYWKTGGFLLKEDGTSVKTKTLEAFEKKYDDELIAFAEEFRDKNIHYLFFHYQAENEIQQQQLQKIRENENIKTLLKKFDESINIDWKQNHLDIIKKHMPDSKHGTGGTNWRKFLPPQKQQISYFPEL
jgi:tryptophan 2,3-dioxygenase